MHNGTHFNVRTGQRLVYAQKLLAIPDKLDLILPDLKCFAFQILRELSDMRRWIASALGVVAACPYCGSADIRRSGRRNAFEKGLGLLFLPYRCMRCYRPRLQIETE